MGWQRLQARLDTIENVNLSDDVAVDDVAVDVDGNIDVDVDLDVDDCAPIDLSLSNNLSS